MKNSLQIFVVILLSACYAQLHAQNNTVNSINFFYQEDLDNFLIEHPNANEVLGSVQIGAYIHDLSPLVNITKIHGMLRIRHNQLLQDLSGLEQLESIGSQLWIERCSNLVDVSNLNSLKSIGGIWQRGLYFVDNVSLTAIDGLDQLRVAGGEFIIEGNTALQHINLPAIDSVGNNILIRNNESLTSISGFGDLIGAGNILIHGNAQLPQIAAFNALESIDGNLSISNNTALNQLDAFHNLISIGGYLRIAGNANLNTIDGLGQLINLGDYLRIENNPSLTSISDFENLEQIGGKLLISGNPALENLQGLQNIDAATIEELYLVNNTSLSACDVQSICDFLLADDGYAYIISNAAGCEDAEAIKSACVASVDSRDAPMAFTVYPNPATQQFSLRGLSTSPESVQLINWHGQQMMLQENPASNTFDVRGLPKGIYLLRLKIDRAYLHAKIQIQ